VVGRDSQNAVADVAFLFEPAPPWAPGLSAVATSDLNVYEVAQHNLVTANTTAEKGETPLLEAEATKGIAVVKALHFGDRFGVSGKRAIAYCRRSICS
jgi:hypothetical protein